MKIEDHFIDLTILSITIFLVLYFWFGTKKQNKKLNNAFNHSFKKDEINLPNLKKSNLYDYPYFEITFKTKRDMEIAKQMGLTSKFEEEIKRIYIKINDFSTQKAITYYYEK